MSEFGEAAGTALEGGLAARALAPRAGGTEPPSDGGHFRERACLNCGTELIGPHCHACGQKAHLHRTLGALGHDIAHGALHLDGKTWRTLPLLAWRPGELTRRYIHGERAKFVSPMALFLFSIFLMFAVFQAIGITAPTDITTSEGLRSAITEARSDVEGQLERRRARLADMAEDSPERERQQRLVAQTEEELESLRQAESMRLGASGALDGEINLTGIEWIDEGLVDKWRENPGLMLYKLQNNSYKFSWLLIPLSLPFMWLLFAWKRGVRVYDHAIFVTYSIAFMSLLFVVASLLGIWGVPGGVIAPLVTLLPAWHLYRQLRGAYGLSRVSALWRLAVLAVMIVVIIMLFLQILLILGAF
jgi:hypothetical protein